jgi:hypothetical protein
MNDTAPTGTFTLSSSGTPVPNLTGATVTMHAERPDGSLITRAAGGSGLTVTSSTNPATIGYDPQIGDLTFEGTYRFEFEVVYVSGKRQTFGEVLEYVDGELG